MPLYTVNKHTHSHSHRQTQCTCNQCRACIWIVIALHVPCTPA